MTIINRLKGIILATLLLITSMEIGAVLHVPGINSFIGEAAAIVGRPLTPVSVAGVGRRTVRRCAAGVYVC